MKLIGMGRMSLEEILLLFTGGSLREEDRAPVKQKQAPKGGHP